VEAKEDEMEIGGNCYDEGEEREKVANKYGRIKIEDKWWR